MRSSSCCFAIFVLTSCAHVPRGSCHLNAALESLASRHQVAAPLLEEGGELDVQVAFEPALSGHFRVGIGGSIEFPLCGAVNVAELDAARASLAIAACLRDGYLHDPGVSVRITKHSAHQVGVVGQVLAPKPLEYVRGMTLSQAIVAAGGLTCNASELASIERVPADQRSIIHLGAVASGEKVDVPLRPSDVVFIAELP